MEITAKEQQALVRAREEEMKRIEGIMGRIEDKISKTLPKTSYDDFVLVNEDGTLDPSIKFGIQGEKSVGAIARNCHDVIYGPQGQRFLFQRIFALLEVREGEPTGRVFVQLPWSPLSEKEEEHTGSKHTGFSTPSENLLN